MAAAQAIQVQKIDPPATYDEESMTPDNPPPQKLGGVFFWMVGGLTIIKDFVVDPLAIAGQALGMAATASLIGSVAGIPIIIISWGTKVFFGTTVFAISYAYFWTHGGLHSSAKIKRLGVLIFCFITSIVPMADLLPETTFLFFFVAWLENAIRQNNLVAHALRFGVNKFAK